LPPDILLYIKLEQSITVQVKFY